MAERKTPSARIIEAASDVKTVTDKAGRKITFRTLDLLENMNLLKLLGEHSDNDRLLTIAGLVYSVTDIDGVPVPSPTTEVALNGMIKRVGNDGVAAIVAQLKADNESEAE